VNAGRPDVDAIAALDCARVGTIAGRQVPAMVTPQALPGRIDYAIAALVVMAGLRNRAGFGWRSQRERPLGRLSLGWLHRSL
jgi:hypothetical protein